ncbi:hypothetical protein HMPREF9162_2325 [Selenomonas sp. oral taxon 137 str. F0430]|nr:hypothetical protein HMPREF9162_2325 [Selenomonas sp. oral taxon 137 str. F0430]
MYHHVRSARLAAYFTHRKSACLQALFYWIIFLFIFRMWQAMQKVA